MNCQEQYHTVSIFFRWVLFLIVWAGEKASQPQRMHFTSHFCAFWVIAWPGLFLKFLFFLFFAHKCLLFIFFFNFLVLYYMYMFYLHVGMSTMCVSNIHWGQKSVLDPPELELLMIVSHQVGYWSQIWFFCKCSNCDVDAEPSLLTQHLPS